jgi:enoyl-CoA hydratase
MVYTGDTIGADEAQQIGLVSRVVADVDVDNTAHALAHQVAGYSRTALRLQKALVRRWYYTEALDRAVKVGIDQYAHAFEVSDPREAIDAFLEKRDIRFD